MASGRNSSLLLLDFDGVLLNNYYINNKIQERAGLFMSSKLHISYDHAQNINKKYYKKFGHTIHLMNYLLKHMHTKSRVTLDDFNNFVYNSRFIDECADHINDSDLYVYDQWNNVIDALLKKSIISNTFIFSNAPTKWLSYNVEMLNEKTMQKRNLYDKLISVPENYGNLLKPDIRAYSGFSKNYDFDEYIFVDDNLINLVDKSWENFLYSSESFENKYQSVDIDCNKVNILYEPNDLLHFLE